MNDVVLQVIIASTGGGAIWLVNQDKPWSKWGSVVGTIGQPFWLYTSYINEQWGIFLLSLFYLYCWCQGIYNNFYRKGKTEWSVEKNKEMVEQKYLPD